MGRLFVFSIFILWIVIGLHALFAVAAPFSGNWSIKTKDTKSLTPRTTQVAISRRGILTILDLPILIPSLPPSAISTAIATGVGPPTSSEALKVPASIQRYFPDITGTVSSLSMPIVNITSTRTLWTTLQTNKLPQIEAKVITNFQNDPQQVSAHVPVRYVHGLPQTSTEPAQDHTSLKRLKPRAYVTKTIVYTITEAVYVATPTSKPKSKSTPPPPTQPTKGVENPSCNGLYRYPTNHTTRDQIPIYYYFDYNLAVHHINKYCNEYLKSLPGDHNQGGLKPLQVGTPKDRDSFTIGVYWPPTLPGAKPQAEICVYTFQSILLDGCDGNDPRNPLNWKGGGTYFSVDIDGTYRKQIYYSMKAIGKRKGLITQRTLQCSQQTNNGVAKMYMRGAGWAGDEKLANLNIDVTNACGKVLENWRPVSLINEPGSFEWEVYFRIPVERQACFLGVVRGSYGDEVECREVSWLGV
ncbi:hypothetical protein TWF481_009311 [Arthrobotrys musiformis]|uniref:Uncharacterized protein n=1 Tax=Arthrobotrys musiformis TaxID=47236 RepID=A0AAV9W4H9_9PEZI